MYFRNTASDGVGIRRLTAGRNVPDIVALPKKRSHKEWCRLYMLGELKPSEYATGGGIFRLMRIADGSKSDIASVQALEKLAKLADLEHYGAAETTVDVNLLPPEMKADSA